MRNLYLLIVITFFNLNNAHAQRILRLNSDNVFEITGIVAADSISADKLYSNAKIFVATTFESGKEVSQLNDDNTKTVVGNGSYRVKYRGLNAANEHWIRYSFVIQCKDGRYRYDVKDFKFQNFNGAGPGSVIEFNLENRRALNGNATQRMQTQIFEQLNDDMLFFTKALEKNMRNATINTRDDW